MGYLDTLDRAMVAHGFSTFSPGGAAGLPRLDQAIGAANARFANVASGADWQAIAAQFAAMAPAVRTVSVKHDGGGLRVVLGRTPPAYSAASERDFIEAAGNWMKAMRTAGAAYKLNDATKSALAGAATAAGAAGPLLTGLNLVLSFAEFHRELFCVILDVGENITQQLRADWAATDLAVVTSGGFTRVYGWLWDITTQTVTGGGHGALDQVESFTVGLGWPRDLENSVRQLWA